jgi:signal transduction histidine kinase
MSIAKKATLVVALLAGLLLAAVGYAALLLREEAEQEQLRTQVKLLATILKVAAESELSNQGQMGALESLVARTREASVTFYGTDGRVVAPAPAEETPVVNARAFRVMDRDQAEEELVSGAYAYRVPLHYHGKVAGALELWVDFSALMRAVSPRASLIIAGGLLCVFALLVGVFTRTSIGRPIDQLMGGMDHVIRGDLTVALPLDRNDEIGRIAYRFNEMTAQLRDAQEEIRRSAEARIQLEQRLRRSEKLATIGQLSAEIAHEVGTPLNVIGGRARSLARKADQPAEVLKNSGIIADQAERITKIIQRVLDLSRARIPERTEVDLKRVVRDAVALMEYQIESSTIQVVERHHVDVPPVKGDADGLQQVFINLVLNGIQAMATGGTLTVTTRAEIRRKEGLDLAPPQPFAVVEIADTGEGIPDEAQGQIFEPFYSTKPRGEGTGLGLTVVHGIVKDHDGWVEVDRASPRGTIFRVYLPIEEQTDPRADDTREI